MTEREREKGTKNETNTKGKRNKGQNARTRNNKEQQTTEIMTE